MPEVDTSRDEPPTTIRNHTVWLRPTQDDDWTPLTRSTPPYSRFQPNLLCVIVTESPGTGQVFTKWSQAREEHSGEGWTRCDGTQETSQYRPDWWREAELFAEKVVRERIRDDEDPQPPRSYA